MIRIEINTDNAAFDGDDERAEVARILRTLAYHMESGYMGTSGEHTQNLRDINGNVVGSLEVI
jgi:hypothetical protein